MSIPDRYKHKDSWPHTFTKADMVQDPRTGYPRTQYICTHCYLTYIDGEHRPIGVCPARNDRSELNRLGKPGADINDIF